MKSEMDRDMDFAGNLQDAGDENDEDSDEDAGKTKNYVKLTWQSFFFLVKKICIVFAFPYEMPWGVICN